MTFSEKIKSEAYDRLRSFLNSPDRPGDTFTYNELCGFLFAIACAPEMIPPSDWLELIFGDEDANYCTAEEANAITQTIMILYNQLNQQVVDGELSLPASCVPVKEPLDNFSDEASLSQWAQGFLIGHSYLEELWDNEAVDEWGEELASCLMVLTFFADIKLAEAYQEEAISEVKSLNQLAKVVLDIFEEAMQSYAGMGRILYLALLGITGETDDEFGLSEMPDLDEACPCGSGKQFMQCCGAQKTIH